MLNKPKGYTVECPYCEERAWLPGYGDKMTSTTHCLCESCGPIDFDDLSKSDQKRFQRHKVLSKIVTIIMSAAFIIMIWAYFNDYI